MESLVLQVSCVFLMFLLHFGVGLSPFLLVRCCDKGRQSSELPSWINCVTGGVFIAMCFLGLIPYAEDKFDETDFASVLPMAQIFVVAGVFFVLLLESAVRLWLFRGGVKTHQASKASIDIYSEEARDAVDPLMEESPHSDEMQVHVHGGVSWDDILTSNSPNKDSSVIFLFMAINLHAFFEGVALGLQTEPKKLVPLFIGILVHEIMTSFALGVSVVRKRFPFVTVAKYLFSFAASIPLGIGVGIAISVAPGNGGAITSACLQAFSAGVLLHVIFSEIIPAELSKEASNFVKIFYFMLGFVAFGCVGGLLHHVLT